MLKTRSGLRMFLGNPLPVLTMRIRASRRSSGLWPRICAFHRAKSVLGRNGAAVLRRPNHRQCFPDILSLGCGPFVGLCTDAGPICPDAPCKEAHIAQMRLCRRVSNSLFVVFISALDRLDIEAYGRLCLPMHGPCRPAHPERVDLGGGERDKDASTIMSCSSACARAVSTFGIARGSEPSFFRSERKRMPHRNRCFNPTHPDRNRVISLGPDHLKRAQVRPKGQSAM